jgi:hypothetical protein
LQLFCHNRKPKVLVWHIQFQNSESSFFLSDLRLGLARWN